MESDYNRLYSQAYFYGAGGEEQEGKSLFPWFLSPFFPPPYFQSSIGLFPHPGPSSSLNSQDFLSPLLPSLFPYSSLAPTFFALFLLSQNSDPPSITFIRNMGRNMSYFGCADLLLQAMQMI